MEWRREREIEAALSVHRTDELGAKARSSSRQGLKRTLAKSLPDILELMCEANRSN